LYRVRNPYLRLFLDLRAWLKGGRPENPGRAKKKKILPPR
jgi:hypothetical protein